MTREEWDEVIKTYIREHGEKHNDDYWIDNSVLFEFFKTLPPVTPQPKIGHWVDDKCSVCGKGIEDLISSPEWYRNEEPSFCPYCGVKLEGVSE